MSLNNSVFILILAFSSLALCQKEVKKIAAPVRGGGGHFLFSPSYLSNLTKEEKQEYYNIFGDAQLTFKQQEEKRLAFAEKHGFAQAIKDDVKLKEENHELVRKERPEVIKHLLEAHNELMKIYDNKDQTFSQREAAISAVKQKYPNAPATLYYISRLITGSKKRHPLPKKH
uniref:DUF148 domain-containing protein n=1 Tax=Caenorhabditis tropicalis TaxID=1561998 RepID=A0A1I7UCS4_9PELO